MGRATILSLAESVTNLSFYHSLVLYLFHGLSLVGQKHDTVWQSTSTYLHINEIITWLVNPGYGANNFFAKQGQTSKKTSPWPFFCMNKTCL